MKQGLPAYRLASAAPGPLASVPARGWQPTKRSASAVASTPAMTGPFTLPMSITSASGATCPAMAAASGTRLRTGADSTTSSAPRTASAGPAALRSTIPRSSASAPAAGWGSNPTMVRA